MCFVSIFRKENYGGRKLANRSSAAPRSRYSQNPTHLESRISSGLIWHAKTSQTPRRLVSDSSRSDLGPGIRRARPSSHARRQGLGSPRAIGTHMRRPGLRKCSLSFLLSLYPSRSPSIHAHRSVIRRFRRLARYRILNSE